MLVGGCDVFVKTTIFSIISGHINTHFWQKHIFLYHIFHFLASLNFQEFSVIFGLIYEFLRLLYIWPKNSLFTGEVPRDFGQFLCVNQVKDTNYDCRHAWFGARMAKLWAFEVLRLKVWPTILTFYKLPQNQLFTVPCWPARKTDRFLYITCSHWN